MGKASAPQTSRKRATSGSGPAARARATKSGPTRASVSTEREAPDHGRRSKGSVITFGILVGIGVAASLVIVAQSRGKKAEVQWGDFSLSLDTGSSNTGSSNSPEQQQAHERSIEQSVESKVREAPPTRVVAQLANLTGTWTNGDGSLIWNVTSQNGQLVYSEQRPSAPGWITAAGYGPFDGHVWTASFQDLNRRSGIVRLTLVDERTLSGEVEAYGQTFDLELERADGTR